MKCKTPEGTLQVRLSAYPVGLLSPKLHKAWALQEPQTATPHRSTKWGPACNFSTLEDLNSHVWRKYLNHKAMLGNRAGSQPSCFPICQVLQNYWTRQEKKKKTKRWVTSLQHTGHSQGKSKNYKFNFCLYRLLTWRDRALYQLGL